MPEDLHRKFGVEGNNETWRLLAEGGPGGDASQQDKARFLYRAFSSAYHWMESESATPINWARGEHLIARAAVAVGEGELALKHAQLCLELCQANSDASEDWDFAFAEEAIARAHALLGDSERATAHHGRAAGLGATIADDDDREVFLEELAREPWFGLVP